MTMRDRIYKAIPLLLVVLILLFLADRHYFNRHQEKVAKKIPVIPERFPKIRAGDWFMLSHDGEIIRQVCTEVVLDAGKRVVRYRLEYLDADKNVVRTEDREMDGPEPYAADVNETAAKGKTKVDVIAAEVGGKRITAYRAVFSTGMEIWFSNQISIDGVVRVSRPGGLTVLPLDFGRYETADAEATDG